MRIIDTIKSWLANIKNRGEITKVLGLPSDALNYDIMTDFRDAWLAIYSGTEFKDVKDPKIAATVCAEAARLVVSEMECSAGDSARAKWINEQMEKNILSRAKEITEYAAASGGIMLKPRYNGETMVLDIMSNFYPLQYDSNGIYGCIFIDPKRIGDFIYTRIERYKYKGNGVYEVENKAFKAKYTTGTIGKEISLSEVPDWANIEPSATILGAPGPMFVYYKMPGANNVDFNSPLGVSLFSKAVDSIKAATTAYNAIDWEVEGGELKRYRDMSTFTEFDKDGNPVLDTKRKKEYMFNGNAGEENGSKLFETFSPELRVDKQILALNRHLNQIEAQTGFTQGTFSIDAKTGMATATQVKSDNQKTYSTVNDIQKAFETALGSLVELFDFYGTVYNLAPKGELNPSYGWDDSIIESTAEKRTRMQSMTTQGKFPLWRYYYEYEGYSEEEARAIAAEVEGVGEGIEFGDSDFNDGGAASAKQGIKDATGKTLNGAQVTSLVGVLEKVKAGTISRAAAIALITSSFGMTEEQANKLLAEDVIK